MTLIETAEREVIEAARSWERTHGQAFVARLDEAEVRLFNAVNALEERESKITEQSDVDTETPKRIKVAMREVEQRLGIKDSPEARKAIREAILIADAEVYDAIDQTPAFPSYFPEGPVDIPPMRHVPDIDALLPPPRPGAEPIVRKPKRLSRKAQAIEARRRSDPMGADRPDVDYSDDSLPTAR